MQNNNKIDTEYYKVSMEHFKKFLKTVPSSVEVVTMILRCHLLAEYYLDKLIELKIPRGDIITENRFQFYDKLIIVEAFDVIEKDLLDVLRKLNKIRNACSHVLSYEISEEDIDKLGAPLKASYIEIKKKNKNKKDLLHNVLLIIMARFSGAVQNLSDKVDK